MRCVIAICAAVLLAVPAAASTRAQRQQHALAAAFYQCLTMVRVACR